MPGTATSLNLLYCRSIFLATLLVAIPSTGIGAEAPNRRGPWPLAETKGPKVEVLAYDNGDVSPWIEFFRFDSRQHPKMVQLRKDFELDSLVADCETDLSRAVVLKSWVARALKFGTPAEDVFNDWSAVALLERARQGQVVWCGQAAMVFQQACLAVGMPARYIEVGRPENPACHFTVEVFLREHNKWAVVDPTPLDAFNVYYTVEGVPQSALEMHRHVVNDTISRVTEVHPDREHAVRDKESPARSFYYLRWLTRCDVVTNTPEFFDLEHVFDRVTGTVDWTDDKTVPWEKSEYAAWFIRKRRLSAWQTSDAEVVSWIPTDRVKILICPSEEGYLFGHLWTGDQEFAHYQIRLDDEDWEDMPRKNTRVWSGKLYGWGLNRFSVQIAPGDHAVQVRVVRRDGTTGKPSFVRYRIQ